MKFMEKTKRLWGEHLAVIYMSGGIHVADAPKEIRMSDCENLIKQIRDVISVSIVTNDKKEIEEIHVLAEDSRNAKQLVRDIETLFRVEYDIDLDHKKISVVQLHKNQHFANGNRLKFSAFHFSLQGTQLEVTVEITSAKRSCEGKCSGINSRLNCLRLVADATVQALNNFVDTGCCLMLDHVQCVSLGGKDLVLTALTYVQGSVEESLVGSALVRNDEKEAAARATLSALNRRVPVNL
jgi:hypothetical protein